VNGGAQATTTVTKGKKKQFELPAVLERFEAKYTIPFSMIDPISSFIAPYCSLDKYSEKEPGLFYRINSLYFDTPGFLFLQQRMRKVEKRFNMRIRSYGDHPQLPYYFEIKQRRGDVVRKFRARFDSTDINDMLHEPTPRRFDDEDDKQFENRQLFSRTAHRYNARPVVLVQYKRKAYVSDYDDYARVTFDIGLRYMQQNEYSPVPRVSEMTPCDAQTCFDAGSNTILELKCYTTCRSGWSTW
jgi:SPX domain protein involved in polyphosphate accumulation